MHNFSNAPLCPQVILKYHFNDTVDLLIHHLMHRQSHSHRHLSPSARCTFNDFITYSCLLLTTTTLGYYAFSNLSFYFFISLSGQIWSVTNLKALGHRRVRLSRDTQHLVFVCIAYFFSSVGHQA